MGTTRDIHRLIYLLHCIQIYIRDTTNVKHISCLKSIFSLNRTLSDPRVPTQQVPHEHDSDYLTWLCFTDVYRVDPDLTGDSVDAAGIGRREVG